MVGGWGLGSPQPPGLKHANLELQRGKVKLEEASWEFYRYYYMIFPSCTISGLIS